MAYFSVAYMGRQISDVNLCLLPAPSQKEMSEYWHKCLQALHQSTTESQVTLDTEAYIVQRLIYKDSAAFRAQKIMSAIRQVRRCVHGYAELKLASFLRGTVQTWSNCAVDGSFLPSRDFIHHLLLVLYRGSGLLSACTNYCLRVYRCIQDNLQLQHFVPNMILFAGTVARIWCICLALLLDFITCYNSLSLVKHKFPLREASVAMKDETDLPQCLSDLLPAYLTEEATKGGALWNVWHQFQSSESSAGNLTEENNKDKDCWRGKAKIDAEDVGEVITRQEDNNRPAKDEQGRIKRKSTVSSENRESTSTTVCSEPIASQSRKEAITQSKLTKEKCLKLPSCLGTYSKSVYTDEKVCKKFLRYMTRSSCRVKVKGHKVQLKFGRNVCTKLSKEVSFQKGHIGQQEPKEWPRLVKHAVKRLKKRLMKAVVAAVGKACTTEGVDIKNYSESISYSPKEDLSSGTSDSHVKVVDVGKPENVNNKMGNNCSKVKTSTKKRQKVKEISAKKGSKKGGVHIVENKTKTTCKTEVQIKNNSGKDFKPSKKKMLAKEKTKSKRKFKQNR